MLGHVFLESLIERGAFKGGSRSCRTLETCRGLASRAEGKASAKALRSEHQGMSEDQKGGGVTGVD